MTGEKAEDNLGLMLRASKKQATERANLYTIKVKAFTYKTKEKGCRIGLGPTIKWRFYVNIAELQVSPSTNLLFGS